MCFCKFSKIQNLTSHLYHQHEIPIEEKQASFTTFNEFKDWKEDIEQDTKTTFVSKCAPYITDEITIYYYYCNRAGTYKPEGEGKRQLKSQGTSKIGDQCSAYMKANVNKDNTVTVYYYTTHYNHQTKIAHLKMPEKLEVKFAKKLELGVLMERILDDIKDAMDGSITKELFVKRQHLYNIKRKYNIDNNTRHTNDQTSVNIWVQEMSKQQYNPILLYKKQGVGQDEEMDNIGIDDFVLCIQTEFQRDMLRMFAKNAICIDSTHGTNMYDFHLVSIVVIDEYGEGIPVAWMVTNREDIIMLTYFFEAIKAKAGDMSPRWFMSDDCETYYTAWQAVFGKESRKILCAWHLHRTWRRALNEHIKEKKEQITIYHHLNLLLSERVESKFRVILQEFLTYYCNRLQQWAPCYREGSSVNTNMYLESFHSLLKIIYMKHKQNKRIDQLMLMLMKIARDKAYERLYKLEIGKNSHRTSEVNKHHKRAIDMFEKTAINVVEWGWTVASETTTDKTYMVTHDTEQCKCKIRCSMCNACPHMYHCSCMDTLLNVTVCKHAHLIHMNYGESQTNITSTDTNELDELYFKKILTKLPSQDRSNLKESIIGKIHQLEILLKADHDDESLMSITIM
jgi:hypothetical protein